MEENSNKTIWWALGILAIVLGIIGLNGIQIYEYFVPKRAEFRVESGRFKPTEITLSATNIGSESGLVGRFLDCKPQPTGEAGGMHLQFRAASSQAVNPDQTVQISFFPHSTWFDMFIPSLENETLSSDEQPDSRGNQNLSSRMGGPWRCSLTATDKHGNVGIAFEENTLVFMKQRREIFAYFSSTD